MNRRHPARKAWILSLFTTAIFAFGARAQLRFIPNAGQWPEPFAYRADIPGGAAFLQGNKIWYNFSNGALLEHLATHPQDGTPVDTIVKGHAISLEYLGASEKLRLSPENTNPTLYNYYLGREPHWRTGLHASRDVRYSNLYPGIDMVAEGANDALKYTYYIHRGAEPASIRIRIAGASSVELRNGALRIVTTVNEIREEAPAAWQYEGDKKIFIPVRYALRDNVITFEFPQGYDSKLDLIIDPYVVFASYSGSTADNFGYTATYDDNGNAYGGGDVWAQGYPVTTGAYQKIFKGVNGRIDAGIMKLSPDGKTLIYATYLGGTERDRPHSMIVNADGELIVLGTTASVDFPVTKNAFDTVTNGFDIFISRFSQDGSKLLASTVIGGKARDGVNDFSANKSPLKYNYADEFRGEILVDGAGDVYVASTTHSSDFPTTLWSMKPSYTKLQEAVVFRMNKDLTKLKWGTYIGGTGCEAAYSMQFDVKGNLYVCGGTTSQNLFSDSKMYQKSITYGSIDAADSADAFVCELTSDSGKFVNGTYFGTSGYDQAYFVQIDTSGGVYIYGQTRSTNFPIVNAHYQDSNSGQFIALFNPKLDSLLLSTLFGKKTNNPDISPTAFLVDNCGKVYISGWGGVVNLSQFGGHGGSTDGLKVTPDAFQPKTDGSDFYIAVFAPRMDTLLFASFFGNSNAEEHVDGGTSRFDKHAVVYQSVCGSCDYTTYPNPDPITTPGAHSRINMGKRPGSSSPGCNNLVLKLDVRIPDIVAEFSAPAILCKANIEPAYVSFKNTSKHGKSYFWDFGDGTEVEDFEPVHAYSDTGTFKVRLVVLNPVSCSLTDTFFQTIHIIQHSEAAFRITDVACGGLVTLEAQGPGSLFSWNFGDGTFADGQIISHRYTNAGTYDIRLYVDSGTLCFDSSRKSVTIVFPLPSFAYTIDTCSATVTFINTSANAVSYSWTFGDSTTDTIKNPVHKYKKNGTYLVRLTVKDISGCESTNSYLVTIKNELVASFGFVQDTCSGKVVFTNYSQHAKKYLWNFGDGTTDTARNTVHYFLKDSAYDVFLIASSGAGCLDTVKRKIGGVIPPKAGFSFTKDSCTSTVKFRGESFRATSETWIFGDGSDTVRGEKPQHTYRKRGNYTVTYIINEGASCADTATKEVYVSVDNATPATIPNVFTPNGDGKNDVFMIDGITPCHFIEVVIYNRWGQQVFEASGNKLAWDGKTSAGKELPAGVYYYVFKDPIFGEVEGTVTLLRD